MINLHHNKLSQLDSIVLVGVLRVEFSTQSSVTWHLDALDIGFQTRVLLLLSRLYVLLGSLSTDRVDVDFVSDTLLGLEGLCRFLSILEHGNRR